MSLDFSKHFSRPIVAIVVPHPDDLEILAGSITVYFIEKGWQVVEILMTGGEYGIVNRFNEKEAKKIKGKILRNIRKIENQRAKEAYGYFKDGIQKVLTIRMNYIDGYLPFSKKTINHLLETLKSIKPKIVIGPDPIFSIDWHHDHMNTAYNLLFAIKEWTNNQYNNKQKKKVNDLPGKYYLFQTFRPNRKYPICEKYWNIIIKAMASHKSQLTPLGIKLMITIMKKIYYPLKRNFGGVREIDIKNLMRKNIKTSIGTISKLKEKIIYSILADVKPDSKLYSPTPDELGLLKK